MNGERGTQSAAGAGPWTEYQNASQAVTPKPWEEYARATQSDPDDPAAGLHPAYLQGFQQGLAQAKQSAKLQRRMEADPEWEYGGKEWGVLRGIGRGIAGIPMWAIHSMDTYYHYLKRVPTQNPKNLPDEEIRKRGFDAAQAVTFPEVSGLDTPKTAHWSEKLATFAGSVPGFVMSAPGKISMAVSAKATERLAADTAMQALKKRLVAGAVTGGAFAALTPHEVNPADESSMAKQILKGEAIEIPVSALAGAAFAEGTYRVSQVLGAPFYKKYHMTPDRFQKEYPDMITRQMEGRATPAEEELIQTVQTAARFMDRTGVLSGELARGKHGLHVELDKPRAWTREVPVLSSVLKPGLRVRPSMSVWERFRPRPEPTTSTTPKTQPQEPTETPARLTTGPAALENAETIAAKSKKYGLGLMPTRLKQQWINIYESIVLPVAEASNRPPPTFRLEPRLSSIASTDGEAVSLLESLADAHARGDITDGELAFIVAHEAEHIQSKHPQNSLPHEIEASRKAAETISRAGFKRSDAVSALRKIRQLKTEARNRGEISTPETPEETTAHSYYEQSADVLEKQGSAPAGDPGVEELLNTRLAMEGKIILGKPTKVAGTKNQMFDGHYALVPRDMLVASHDAATFEKNPAFALENPRDYSSPAEREKVLSIRQNYDAAQEITDSPSAAVGPPIVKLVTRPDGTRSLQVVGGNTRTMVDQTLSSEKQAEKADVLTSKLRQFGFALDTLPDPGLVLVRYTGEANLQEPEQARAAQAELDAMNPAPGKVQNLAEMAAVDAASNIPLETLRAVPADATPEQAQEVVAGLVRDGKLDRNLRSQVAESKQQAAEYLRLAMLNAAYRQRNLADALPVTTDRGGVAVRGLVESAVPAMLEMRAKGQNEMADAFTRSMGLVVEEFANTGKLEDALDVAARQLDMDKRFAVAQDVAAALKGALVFNKAGKLQSDDTIDAFKDFWGKVRNGLAEWTEKPDMFGESRTPEDVIRAVVGKKITTENTLRQGSGQAEARSGEVVRETGPVLRETPATYGAAAANPWPENFPDLLIHTNVTTLKADPSYNAAKAGNPEAAFQVVERLAKVPKLKTLAAEHPNAILVPVTAIESTGTNAIPRAFAEVISRHTGLAVETDIVQSNIVRHTGAKAMDRLINKPTFDGPIKAGSEYIGVDDVTTSGSTVAALRQYIEARGGKFVAATSLATTSDPQTGYGGHLAIRKETLDKLKPIYDIARLERVLHDYGIANSVGELTNSQGRYLATLRDLNSPRDKLSAAIGTVSTRVPPGTVPQTDQGLIRENGRNLRREIKQTLARPNPVQYELDFNRTAGGNTTPSGVRGPETAAGGAPKLGDGAQESARGFAGGIPDEVTGDLTPEQIETLERRAVWLRDPAAHAPEIAAALEETDRISVILPEMVSGKLPRFDLAGKIIRDSTDWAVLNLALRNPGQESFRVAATGRDGRIVHAEVISMGNENSSYVNHKAILRFLARAQAMTKPGTLLRFWQIHNHPSGDPTPSVEDMQVHRDVKEMFKNRQNWTFGDACITDGDQFWSHEFTGMQPLPIAEEQNRPAWEGAKLETMPEIREPEQLRKIIGALHKAGKSGVFVGVLNTKNKLIAVSVLPAGLPPETLGQAASDLAVKCYGTAMIIGTPGQEMTPTSLADWNTMRKVAEKKYVQVLDVLNGSISLRETNALQFETTQEARPPYGSQVRETRPEYGGPFPTQGTPDPAEAIKVAINTGPLKLRDWESLTLANLEMVRPIEMPEMYRLVKELGAQFSVKKLKVHLGCFKPTPAGGKIALDPRIFRDPTLAAKVISHEIGHLDDWLPDRELKRGNLKGRLRSLKHFMRQRFGTEIVSDKELRTELLALTHWWTPWDEAKSSKSFNQYRKSAIELYAEATSVLLNAPAEIKARAPKFWAEFVKGIDTKPEVKWEFIALWDMLAKPEDVLLTERSAEIQRMFGKGEELLLRKSKEREARFNTVRGWQDTVMQMLYDRYHRFIKLARQAKAAGKPFKWDQDPEARFDESPLGENKSYLMTLKIAQQVAMPLKQAEVDLNTFSEFLFHDRNLNEVFTDPETGETTGRSVMANPTLETPEVARRQLQYMRRVWGQEDSYLVEEAAKRFHDITWDVIENAADAGLISKEQLERMRPNKYHYATYATLDGFERSEKIPAGIRHQMGTVSELLPVFDATLMKMQALAVTAEYNRTKRVAADLLALAGEWTPAEMTWSGKGQTPRPAPADKALFTYYDDGKLVAGYVDPEFESVFEHMSPAENRSIWHVLRWTFRTLTYPLIITYQPGFALYANPIKDLNDTFFAEPSKNPVTSARRMWRVYRNGWNFARKILRHETDPLAMEMLENFVIMAPNKSWILGETPRDRLLKMAQNMGIRPEDRPAWARNWAVRNGWNLLDWLKFTGQTFELMPKMGEYKILREELGWPARKAAQYIRNNVGTPNWLKKGTHTFEIDAFVPFYNIALRGLERNWKLALGKTHAGGRTAWWWKWASTRGLWTVLKAMGATGILGTAIKEWYDLVGDQKKTNNDLIPLGIHPVGDERKAVGIVIPKSESTRMLDGLLYKGLTAAWQPEGEDPRRLWQHVEDVTAFLGSELPGFNPWVDIPRNWATAATGHNFYDRFTGNPVLTRDEETVGGLRAAKKVLTWSLKAGGLSTLTSFFYHPETDTTLESVVSLPGLSRMIMVTDYGLRERLEWKMQAADRDLAMLKTVAKPAVQVAYREYVGLRRIPRDLRTDDEQERYIELARWYVQTYSPLMQAALQALQEDNSPETARSYAREIEAPE